MNTVLVACHNPTLQGEVIWEGHAIVAYVDITPALRTQEERTRFFQEQRDELVEQEQTMREELEDPDLEEDERESAEQFLEDLTNQKEEIEEDSSKPLDVERLSKLYYQGWNSLPGDLKVDTILAAYCPLGELNSRELKSLEGAYNDIFVKAVAFLKPGGQLIITNDTTKKQPLLENMFSVKYAETLPAYPKNKDYEDKNFVIPVMILTKKTGGSKKTRKVSKKNRRTRRR